MTRKVMLDLDLSALPPWLALVALEAAEETVPDEVPVLEGWTAWTDERGVSVLAGWLGRRGLVLPFRAPLLLVRTDGLARVAQGWVRLGSHACGLRLPGSDAESVDAWIGDVEEDDRRPLRERPLGRARR